MSATTRRRSAQAAAVVGAVILLVWLTLRPHELDSIAPPERQDTTAGVVLKEKEQPKAKPNPCQRPAAGPFVPTRVTIPGVTRDAAVLALPRDSANVPQAPPISSAGKTQFAWSQWPGDPKPGSSRGNALFNAHTWPDGTAMGNHLLARLHVGDKIIVHGRAGSERRTLCYRVTKRDVIVAANGSFEYYERNGPPQLALIVCSPPRLGPGNWKNRTIWYASPMAV